MTTSARARMAKIDGDIETLQQQLVEKRRAKQEAAAALKKVRDEERRRAETRAKATLGGDVLVHLRQHVWPDAAEQADSELMHGLLLSFLEQMPGETIKAQRDALKACGRAFMDRRSAESAARKAAANDGSKAAA